MNDIFSDFNSLLKKHEKSCKNYAHLAAKEDHEQLGVTEKQAYDGYYKAFSGNVFLITLDRIANNQKERMELFRLMVNPLELGYSDGSTETISPQITLKDD